jgi:hypothetical protein
VEGPGRRSAAFTSDGRVVVADGSQGQARLRVFDPSGAALAETSFDLPNAGQPLHVGPEVAPGRIAVASGIPFLTGGETLVVDLATLAVVERLTGLAPLRPSLGHASFPVRAEGSVHLFVGQGQLVRIDFRTGERKVLAGPGAPHGERLPGI